MDGNGRWARRRGHPASFGHRAGVRAIKRVLEECEKLGVHALSVYAFSTENWTRPRAEVRALMRLFHQTMQREIDEMHRRRVRMFVTETLWPDFDVADLKAAIADYGSRQRRFGGRPEPELEAVDGSRRS